MKTSKNQSTVQLVIGTIYRESLKANGHSWTRLNGILSGTMRNLIAAGVKFEVDDVKKALVDFSGHYWDHSEGWYSSACGAEHGDGGGNLSAAISLEHFFERDPFIWAELTKTPWRLYVGADFTWKGERVTVTSFDDEKHTLTACSYTLDHEYDRDPRVGDLTYSLQGYRFVEARSDYNDGSVAVRFSKKVEEDRRKIKKRFTISNDELAGARADYDQRRRKHELAIAAAESEEQLLAASQAAVDEGKAAYRHFDLEILNAMIAKKREQIAAAMTEKQREAAEKQRLGEATLRLDRWMAGEDIEDYFTGLIRLRIKGEFVECSNGNKVSLDAALKTLPLVHRYRSADWQSNGKVHNVDAFRLDRIDKTGVTIGCTLIGWDEVDRFTPILKAARRKETA
jgi:hypothetical protein